MRGVRRLLGAASLMALACGDASPPLEPVRVASDGSSFVLAESRQPFVPWGLNYDRDAEGRLLEELWDADGSTLEADFREMKALGANVVRIQLQLGRFLRSASEPDPAALAKLSDLLALAERERLYLILTGLGSYRRDDIPAWYAELDEAGRWAAQQRFWKAIAETSRSSRAVFAYDLMNQPLAPARPRKDGDWLAPSPRSAFHRSQWITLEPGRRRAYQIARAWTRRLHEAIDEHDPERLVTVGLVSWSLDRGRLRSGFVPEKIASEVDFLSVHFHPESGLLGRNLRWLRRFLVGKPLLITETSAVRCTHEEFTEFVDKSREFVAGHLGVYRGRPPDELDVAEPADLATRRWLEFFQAEAQRLQRQESAPVR